MQTAGEQCRGARHPGVHPAWEPEETPPLPGVLLRAWRSWGAAGGCDNVQITDSSWVRSPSKREQSCPQEREKWLHPAHAHSEHGVGRVLGLTQADVPVPGDGLLQTCPCGHLGSAPQASSLWDAPFWGCCTVQPSACPVVICPTQPVDCHTGTSTRGHTEAFLSPLLTAADLSAPAPSTQGCCLLLPWYRWESGLRWGRTSSASETFSHGGAKICVSPSQGCFSSARLAGRGCQPQREPSRHRGSPHHPRAALPPHLGVGSPPSAGLCAARCDGKTGWVTRTVLFWQPGKFSGCLENLS